jgi:hypothetical protein
VRQILIIGLLVLGGVRLPADELYDELSASLEQAEDLVAATALRRDASLTPEQLADLEALSRQIRGSLYSDLMDRSELLLLLVRDQALFGKDPQPRVEAMLQDSRLDARGRRAAHTRDRALRIGLATTVVSYTAAFALWGLAELQDRRYFQAATPEEASVHRRLFQVFSIGSVVGAAVGVAGAGVTVTLYRVSP